MDKLRDALPTERARRLGRRIASQPEEDMLPDIDTSLTLLRNERRRRTLAELAAADRPLDIRELADRMAVAEYGDNYDAAQRKRIYVTLYQTHLDQMVDASAVVEIESQCYALTKCGRALSELSQELELRHATEEP